MEKSAHAKRRQQQRGIGDEAVDVVLSFGKEIFQKGGRVAYFLGKKQVDTARRIGQDIASLEGIAVVLGRDGGIITVIRTLHTKLLRKRSR